MSVTSDKIAEALKGKTTGMNSAAIREATGLSGSLFSSTLISMVARGQLIKHDGEDRASTRFSLNPEHIADAPKAAKKKRKTGKRKTSKKARRVAPPQHRKTTAPVERSFIPAITADQELVLVGHGDSPVVFNAEQTAAIATLMLANFTQ